MKTKICLLTGIIFLIHCLPLAAQKYSKSSSVNPNWGLGIRLGDPSGISVKKYMSNKALELSIGRSYTFYNHAYYDKRYDDWYRDWYMDKNNSSYYYDVRYAGYKSYFPLSIQLHYLIHKDLKGVDGLKWYWGVGAQFRHQRYVFDYRYSPAPGPGYPDLYGREVITNIDFGADGVIGLEYTVPKAPVSIFMDAILFMEVVDNPFVFWGQGGIGIRYNFQ